MIICIITVSLVSSWALLLIKTQNGNTKVMHALIGFQEQWAFKSAMMTSMVQSASSSDMISQRVVSILYVFSFRSRSWTNVEKTVWYLLYSKTRYSELSPACYHRVRQPVLPCLPCIDSLSFSGLLCCVEPVVSSLVSSYILCLCGYRTPTSLPRSPAHNTHGNVQRVVLPQSMMICLLHHQGPLHGFPCGWYCTNLLEKRHIVYHKEQQCKLTPSPKSLQDALEDHHRKLFGALSCPRVTPKKKSALYNSWRNKNLETQSSYLPALFVLQAAQGEVTNYLLHGLPRQPDSHERNVLTAGQQPFDNAKWPTPDTRRHGDFDTCWKTQRVLSWACRW